jgi:glucose-6-phosphate 1-dehydrogenase
MKSHFRPVATIGSDARTLPDTVVIFGAAGDLARRMIWPSLYHLHRDRLLPEGLRLVGATRRELPLPQFREFVRQAIEQQLASEQRSEAAIEGMMQRIQCVAADVRDDDALDTTALGAALGNSRAVLYFLSLPPRLYGAICRSLATASLLNPGSRIMLEKPIGHDLASSQQINAAVAEICDEEQIYRIDHYLGKETVQNLLALRFANSLFEPLWNAASIDHVQLTVSETVGVEGRWSYYDDAGALRDMVQNHMLQLVALLAMEPPANLDAVSVRNEKVKVLRSLRPIGAADVAARTVRGQYAAGNSGAQPVPGYNEETGSAGASTTETFVALRAEIDNWRWAGVPFYLRTGKRLQARRTDIVVQFKNVPHNIFSAHHQALPANRLIIRLQPEERITLEVMSKEPGLDGVRLKSVPLELSLSQAFGAERTRIAYERLLLDAIKGNTTLFVRRDEIEAAWEWIDAIQQGWAKSRQPARPYAAGTWGPTAAIALAERHGHSWFE